MGSGELSWISRVLTNLHLCSNLEKVKPMRARDLVKHAESKGWTYIETRGSHMQYGKNGVRLTIVGPLNALVKAGTVRSILKTIEEVG